MRKVIVWITFLFLVGFSIPGFAEANYGSLKIISDSDSAKVYIDGVFEGYGAVSKDKIIAGNHFIQLKVDNAAVFEEMVSVKEGEQTTIVPKVNLIEPSPPSPQPEAVPPVPQPEPATGTIKALTPAPVENAGSSSRKGLSVGVDFSYGKLNLTPPQGSSYPLDTSPMGLGLFLKIPNTRFSDTVIGAHYVFAVQGLQISYAYLDITGKISNFVTSLGINYSMWISENWTSLGITNKGGVGYEAMLGYTLADFLLAGVKYAVFSTRTSGNADWQGSQFLYYISTI